jgi:asparagine synthase (glutamine-hydrolysing)
MFFTRSDTEVVLRSYIQWGSACVEHFNGIFAFAVYDEAEHRVFLARDRIGVKPLFYYERSGRLYFASELPALLAHPDIPHEIDENGVASFSSGTYSWLRSDTWHKGS